MKNQTRVITRSLREMLSIHSPFTFHKYLFDQAMRSYEEIIEDKSDWGSILAICSEKHEPQILPAYPFSKIQLSGFGDQTEAVAELSNHDRRVTYECQNAECLPYASQSIDLVICKEGLHHLARPILGLYEMLRVCRRAVIVIEPFQTMAGNMLERLDMASVFERNYDRNIDARTNYVFRFNRRILESLLNSYYIDSGYKLDIHVGWMRWNVCGNANKAVRVAGMSIGRLLSLVPGSRGNYMTAVIQPGGDVPRAPEPFLENSESKGLWMAGNRPWESVI
jgi:SAM-dependent methyltransferase